MNKHDKTTYGDYTKEALSQVNRLLNSHSNCFKSQMYTMMTSGILSPAYFLKPLIGSRYLFRFAIIDWPKT